MLIRDEQVRERYEARLEAIRDQQSLLEVARELGLGQGVEKGVQIGRIHAYERLLKWTLTPSDDLVQLASDELRSRADTQEAELTGK